MDSIDSIDLDGMHCERAEIRIREAGDRRREIGDRKREMDGDRTENREIGTGTRTDQGREGDGKVTETELSGEKRIERAAPHGRFAEQSMKER